MLDFMQTKERFAILNGAIIILLILMVRAEAFRSFQGTTKRKNFNVSAHAYSRTEIDALLNRLHNVTEYDVRSRMPGKLWLNQQYLSCYLIGSEITEKSRHMLFVTKK